VLYEVGVVDLVPDAQGHLCGLFDRELCETVEVGRTVFQRFLRLREEALEDSSAYFHRFAELSVEQATEMALRVWDEIDHPNLIEHIEPTKDRARLILEKGKDHSVEGIRLRKI
jgi:type I pantothenate kinase